MVGPTFVANLEGANTSFEANLTEIGAILRV